MLRLNKITFLKNSFLKLMLNI